MKKAVSAAVGILFVAAVAGRGAELGRRPVSSQSPAAGSAIEVTTPYEEFVAEGAVGTELDFLWHAADWDVGSQSYDAKVWRPQLSVFYGASRMFDIRATIKYLDMEDNDADAGGDLDLLRLGVGSKLWIPTGTQVRPYAALLINYYVLDSDRVDINEGTFGVSGEAGLAYQMTDSFLLRVGVQGETFLADAEGRPEGQDDNEDVSFSAFSVGLGATLLL